MLLQSGVKVSAFDGLEEVSSGFLLLDRDGKTTNGSTGLVHVTVEFIDDLEPLLLGDVRVKSGQTLLGLLKDSLLTVGVFTIFWVVDTILNFTVDGVWRVNSGRLVTSVSGTLRVRGSVSNNTENRETWGFSDSGLGSDWKEGGGSGGSSGNSLTTGWLSLTSKWVNKI